MARLPLIVGFGGVNAAGRSSFHHSYRRLVIDVLNGSRVDSTYASLAALMGCAADAREHMLAHTLIRRIEPEWFDVDAVPSNRR
ncbi:MAG: beta-ketoacyl synthase, partial [Spongiibacteraceae bacterium]|nr:beta-ketoacyl synthase [Spongiibacteraceae bacterium]